MNSKNWSASIDRGVKGSSSLRLTITGEVETPTPGYTLGVEKGVLDRRSPPSLRVRLIAEAPSEPVIQVVDTAQVSFEVETKISEYQSVIVVCGEQQLAKIDGVKLTD